MSEKQRGSNEDRCQVPEVFDVRLATRITIPVDRRLRMLALVKGRPLSHVLVGLLDQALPSVGELAALLGDSRHRAEPETEAA